MSYAIQCLEEGIISKGGYIDELSLYKRDIPSEVIIEVFQDLIVKGLLSKEYYQNKGHKVLGKMIANTNGFERDKTIKNDSYNSCYKIIFTHSFIFENKKYSLTGYTSYFVGDVLSAREYAKQIKKILKEDKEFPYVNYRIKKETIK